jgi:hypothetical protein
MVVVGAGVIAATDWLCAAQLERAAHEVFPAEFCHGATRFIHGTHGHKGKSFGALSAVVDHDFGIADAADTIEQLEKVAFGSIVGEITDVKAVSGDTGRIDRSRFTTWARLTGWSGGIGTIWTASAVGRSRWGAALSFRKGGRFAEDTEGKEAQDFLKASLFRLATAWSGGAAIGEASAALRATWAAVTAAAIALLSWII